MNGGEGDDEGGPDDTAGGERFADLVGDDTRRLARDKRRVGPGGPSGRGGGKRAPEAKRPTFRWPDPKERGRAAGKGVSDAQLAALSRGEPEPEERIDLHGARRDAAGRLLATRLEAARARGLRCVLVIHGRGLRSPTGEAVLRDALPGWLTKGPVAKVVLAFTPAPDRLGGDGATVVLLRRGDAR